MIIGVSGKISSGKDTVAAIIQYLTAKESFNFTLQEFLTTHSDFQNNQNCTWQNKMFANKIKEIVCILLECTLQQLEDRKFKEKELGEEWMCGQRINAPHDLISLGAFNNLKSNSGWKLRKLTPRLLMQLLGTDCGRDIIHPNIWVNALMSEYKPFKKENGFARMVKNEQGYPIDYEYEIEYPNWIISDLRFPNEMKAVKDREGITIRVNRIYENPCKNILFDEHESETALDYAKFDYVIDNNGTIEELIEQVKQVLIKEDII